MGRGKKVLVHDEVALTENTIDKREVGYYSTPVFIADYIAKRMLQINSKGKSVLDSCCGKEELLEVFLNSNKIVDGFDIIKYKDEYRCNYTQLDFIRFYAERKRQSSGQISFESLNKGAEALPLDYDYYIANPPYNCHEVDYISNNKKVLEKVFEDVGVRNMYSMFISALIDCAKPGALIGLITHDSFFTAKYHENLRRKIVANCAIHEITMCPTDLFLSQAADVRTSILILQKGIENQKKIIVNNRPVSTEILKRTLENQLSSNEKGPQQNNIYSLNEILLENKVDNLEFIIECPDDIKVLFENKRIQDKFRCVTGISTGNDKLYLSTVKQDPYIVPFMKNPGKSRFYTDNFIYLHKDFLKYDKEIKNFMVRNKDILYKPGVTCSSMGVEFTAARLPENTTFGVNPNIICEDYDAWWLIAYLNSDLVTYLVRGFLIRSNMITSGYVSRIPLVELSQSEQDSLVDLSRKAYRLAESKKTYCEQLDAINEIVFKAADIKEETIEIIKKFKEDLIKNT